MGDIAEVVRVCTRWERVVVAMPPNEQSPGARECVVRPLAVRGVWALHEAVPGGLLPWTVSHLPTGRAFSGCTTIVFGLRLLRLLPQMPAQSGFGSQASVAPAVGAELLDVRDAFDRAQMTRPAWHQRRGA